MSVNSAQISFRIWWSLDDHHRQLILEGLHRCEGVFWARFYERGGKLHLALELTEDAKRRHVIVNAWLLVRYLARAPLF